MLILRNYLFMNVDYLICRLRSIEKDCIVVLIVSWILLILLLRKEIFMTYMIFLFVRIEIIENLNCLSDMCTFGRWITNKYTGNRFFVKCGRCKSCLQEKAIHRTNRIRRELSSDRICLFCTLTYDRISCPYVLESDLLQHKLDIPIYRDLTVHRSSRTGKFKRKYILNELDHVVISSDDDNYFVGRYKWLKHRPHKIGVCYFKDFQNFVKRLRINLSRCYIDHEGFSIFNCSEYGPVTKRPHFHFLLFIRPCDEALYRSAILQAWPFASRSRTEKYILLADKDPSSYVASYVNCRTSISPFFAKYFAPKHSFSKYFGISDPQFSLFSILQKIDKGSLDYVVRGNKQGTSGDANFLIPQYVINRFFPKFKGYSRIACHEVFNHILSAGRLLPLAEYDRRTYSERYSKIIGYTAEDLHRISVRLNNAFDYYHKVTGRSIYDYAIDFERCWRCYTSNIFRRLHERTDLALFEKYDNLYEVYNGSVFNDYLYDYISSNCVPLDPNDFPSNKSSSANLVSWFDLYDKNRKVSNYIMSLSYHYV